MRNSWRGIFFEFAATGFDTEEGFSGQDMGAASAALPASAITQCHADSQSYHHGRRSMNPQNSPTPSAPAGDSNPGGGVTESSGTLTETKDKITQTARDAASKVKSAAGSSVTRAKEQAERFAAEKKETTANRIRSYSSAIHDTARSLEEQDPNIAWF